MAEEGSRKREEELRQQLDQLRWELGQERSAKKQLHHDKVRDLKAAKEKEQTAAKEQVESLKLKLQREKNQELQSLRDSMTKDFKSQLRSLQRKHEEEQVGAQKEWRRERQELKQKLQREIQVQVEQEMTAKFEAERRKLMREMFQLESQRKAAEERMADLVAADHSKAEAIRELETQHRMELDQLQRSMRTGSRQQLEELEDARRRLGQKDQEMGRLTEKMQRAQADRERAEEDLKRMRQAESWARASPRATSPTIGSSDSADDLNQPKQPYSKRERDMLIRNSELTFRVRQLEEKIGSLGVENKQLQGKLEEAESSQRPLKEQAGKQSQRINELNAALRSREKQVKQLSQENLELKGSQQHLEEECSRLRRSLTQQMSQSSVYRAERTKLMEKNRRLSEASMSKSSRVEALGEMNASLQRRLSTESLPHSPRPFSPPPLIEDEFGSQVSLLSQDESQAKYEELKGEFINVREHYKELKEKYVELQGKGRDQQAAYRQVQQKYEQLKKEKLSLEHEVSLLRERGKEGFDVRRQQVVMEATQQELQLAEQKLREMEDFVIEQDKVARHQEASFMEERQQLLAENRELRRQLEEPTPEEGVASRETESEEEEEGSQLSRILPVHQDQSLEENLADSEERRGAPVLLGGSLGFDEIDDAPPPGGLSPDMQQWVQHYLQENGILRQELHELQSRLDGSVHLVGELQGTLRALEGELVEEQALHLSTMEDKEEEVLQLRTEVSHMESKLTRMRRAITVGVTQQMSQQLGHKAISAMAKVRHVAMVEQLDIGSLLAELKALESVIYELLQTIFPRDFDTHHPTITEAMSQTPPTITEAVAQTPPTMTEAVAQTPPTMTEAVAQPPPTITEAVSQTPPTITKAVSEAPPTKAVFKAPPTTIEGASDAPPTMFTQPPLEEELLLEPEEPPTPPSSPVPDGPSTEHPLLPGDISQFIQPLLEASPPLPMPPIEQQPEEYEDGASLTSVSLTPSLTPSPPSSLPPSPPPSPPPSEEVELLEQLPPTLPLDTLAPDRSKSASLHITGEPNEALAMPAALQTSSPLTVETAVPMNRLQLQLEDHPPSPVRSLSPPPSPPPSLPPHEDISRETVEATPILVESNPSTGGDGSGTRLFLVVMDYDPHSLCTSGRPDLELTLPTGAIIAVHGDMDDSAYYSATFEGRTGLVPANFVQEMALADSGAQQRLFNQTLTRSLSPSLGLSREATPTRLAATPTKPVATPTKLTTSQPTGSPAPPSGFRVETALGASVLLVCWQPPPTDATGKSSGFTVTGYQLYVNGEPKTFVDGASQTKALLAGLDLSRPQSLGIATCSREGKTSETTPISYMDHLRPDRTLEPHPYRMFVALYDYDPLKCSPSDNPEFELELKEGSLVKVFGQEMDDGFLVGELNGRRGLVPATFVTEVSGSLSSERNNQVSSTHSDTTTLLATSKKMVASFDYMPTESSPNENPDLELRFNKGDVITVFGNMDHDGFYCGELKGMFGLVPSNFLEEWRAEEVEESSPEPPSPLVTECPTHSSHGDGSHVRSTDSGDAGSSVPEHLTNEEGPPPLDLPVSQPATGEGGPPEPSAPDSSKRKGKKRGRGFSFGKDWVKSTFSRKRTGSVI